MTSRFFALAYVLGLFAGCPALSSCGNRHHSTGEGKQVQRRPFSQTPEADRKTRPKSMLWWQGAEPVCTSGTVIRKRLPWGSVYWCGLPGVAVDANLQNDLGRLASCIHASVNAFQKEPTPDTLGVFLADAHDAGLSPVACRVVRRDAQVTSYHGRRVLMERQVLPISSPLAPGKTTRIRYQLSCTDCIVAAETSVELSY